MASLSSMLGGIKSVQRGVATVPTGGGGTVNVSISPVNTAKSFCNVLNAGGYAESANTVQVQLQNSTTLRVTGYPSTPCSWEVIEFY